MGMDWHDLATKLPQICPKKSARNLGHTLACAGILYWYTPSFPAERFSLKNFCTWGNPA